MSVVKNILTVLKRNISNKEKKSDVAKGKATFFSKQTKGNKFLDGIKKMCVVSFLFFPLTCTMFILSKSLLNGRSKNNLIHGLKKREEPQEEEEEEEEEEYPM